VRSIKSIALALSLIRFPAGVTTSYAAEFRPIEVRLVAQAGQGQAVAVEDSDKVLKVESRVLLDPYDFASVGKVEWAKPARRHT